MALAEPGTSGGQIMRRPILLLCAFLVALLAGLAATAILAQPPALRSASQAGQFDAVRAKARLANILGDQQPHPADSFGDDAVRARLIGQIRSLGLTPVVRDQFACNELYKDRGVTCARVRNVIVALGPDGGRALLLNAHYDSTPVGPGAGDDGVGVATLLEVASILRGERLQRPVLLLFNEGEELGLVGARAFLADPLSRKVDSLINLEARGVTGPVTMFETSLPNGPPVRAFAKAVDRPFANSLTTDVYRQLPNYTDVNSFSERGWLTLNFAMIGNETRYHSPGDDIAALDVRSLQHMGDQTLAMARRLAGSNRPDGGGTVLFTDLAGIQLIMLPQVAGFALLGLLIASFAVIGFRRGRLLRGVVLVIAAILVSAGLSWCAMQVMGLARPGSFWRAYPLWTHLAVYACGLLAAVATLATIGRRLTVEQLRAGFWLGFLLIGALVLLVAPGGIIYFLLPPLLALAGILAGRWSTSAERIGAIAAAVLLWLTLGEVLALLGELLNNGPMFIFGPLALLIAIPWLIEAKGLVDGAGRIPAIAGATVLALLGWSAVAVAPAYSADRQQRFVIQHATDIQSGHAYWSVVNDGSPLPKTYGNVAGWHRDELPHLKGKRWIAPAPSLSVRAPQIRLLSSTSRGKLRTVTFRIEANGADNIMLIGPRVAGIVTAGASGSVRPIDRSAKGEYYLECAGRACDGATMEFTTNAAGSIAFTLVGSSRGLPQIARPLNEQRPRFARSQYSPDSTLTISRLAI